MTSSYPTDDKHNRIRGVVDNIMGTENADDLMLELMDAVSSTEVSVPQAGKYYIFVYKPKTQNLQYDAHPLVAVTDILQWGFKGFNYHWGQMRQYTWQEVVGRVYEIYPEELADAQEIPFQNIRLNN